MRPVNSFSIAMTTVSLSIIFAGCAPRPQPLPAEEAPPVAEEPAFSLEETLTLAAGYLEAGRVGEAASYYEQVLEHYPHDFEAHLGLAISLLTMEDARFQNQRDYAGVRQHLEAARDAKPQDPRPHTYLGTISYEEKDYGRAIRHLSEAARLDPAGARAHEMLGLSLAEAGRTEEARTELNRALDINPSLADANFMLGKLYEQINNNGMARAHLERSLSVNPNLHLATYYLERVYYEQHLYDLAESKCKRFLEFYPDDIQSLEILGNIYRLQGRGREVFDTYSRLTRIEPGNTAHWSPVIQHLTDSKDYETARAVLEEALVHNPYYAYGNVHYGKVLIHFADESREAGDRKQALYLYGLARDHLQTARVDDRYEPTALKLLNYVDKRIDGL